MFDAELNYVSASPVNEQILPEHFKVFVYRTKFLGFYGMTP
jgi:hypothetical protein